MKKLIYLFVAAAACLLCSCQVEQVIEENDSSAVVLVAKEFTASMEPETKALLGGDGKSVSWKAGDVISVYDDIDPSVAHPFTAQSTGASVKFSGSVASGATRFYAVYPAEAVVSFDSANERFTVQIPEVQYAVEGGFDPRACVAGAYLEDAGGDPDGLKFKLVNGLLKFSVDYDDVLAVTISNTARSMSGYYTFDVQSASSGKIANVGDGNLADAYKSYRYKDVSLRNEDGTPLTKGASYYMVCRQAGATPYKGVSVSVIREDALIANKVYNPETELVVARKAVRNFGEFRGLSFASKSRYAMYQLGFDLVIGGKVYNKSLHGDAQLKTSSDNSGNIRSYLNNEGDKVTFLANGTYNCGSVTVTDNVAICPDADGPVTVTCNNGWNVKSGSLAVYGLDMSISESNNVTSNGGGPTDDVDYIVFDHCKVSGICKAFWIPNGSSKEYTVGEFVIVNSTLAVGAGNINLININGNTHRENCHKVMFRNNLVYASTGTLTVKVLNSPNSDSAKSTDTVMDIDVQDNIFVNTPHGNMFTYCVPKSIIFKNNIQWETNGTDQAAFGSSKAKLFKFHSSVSTATTAPAVLSDNYAYGMAADVTWTYSDGNADTLMDNLGMTDSGLPDATPLFTTAPSVSAGVCTYTLAPGYTGIGPQ